MASLRSQPAAPVPVLSGSAPAGPSGGARPASDARAAAQARLPAGAGSGAGASTSYSADAWQQEYLQSLPEQQQLLRCARRRA